MAIDWKFQNLKQQALDVYDKQYWQDVASTYTDMGGRINFDESTGQASYNMPSRALPSLPEMWGRYQKGAKSRGAVPDFMTFKKYYGELKTIKHKQMIASLQRAQLEGIPMDKIHKAIRNNPGFRDEIVKVIAETPDENARATLAQYVPPIEQSFGQFAANKKGLIGGTLIGGAVAGQYLMDAPDAMDLDAVKERLKDSPARPKVSDYKIKNQSRFKKGGQKKYEEDLKAWKKKSKAFKQDLRTDITESRQSRLRKFMGKSKMAAPTAFAASIGAPMIAESVSKSMGLNQRDAEKVGAATNIAVTAGYTAPTVLEASKIVTPLWKKGKSISAITSALSKAGLKGKILAAGLMVASSLMNLGTLGSTPKTTTKQKPKEPDFEPVI